MKLSRAEFETLALEHLDMLFRLARRLTRNAASAEDLVQETYVRALRASDSFELKQFGIRPWLIRIMRNLHFTRSQREKRQPTSIESDVLEATVPQAEQLPQSAPFNFDQVDERLAGALEELPAEYQTVMLLWAVEELSYKEIADAVEVPIGTVMSRLHRARQKLAEKLGDFVKEERIIRE